MQLNSSCHTERHPHAIGLKRVPSTASVTASTTRKSWCAEQVMLPQQFPLAVEQPIAPVLLVPIDQLVLLGRPSGSRWASHRKDKTAGLLQRDQSSKRCCTTAASPLYSHTLNSSRRRPPPARTRQLPSLPPIPRVPKPFQHERVIRYSPELHTKVIPNIIVIPVILPQAIQPLWCRCVLASSRC